MTTTQGPHADVREMYMAHTMLRREISLLPAIIRGVADGDTQRSAVVAAHIDLATSVLQHHHHGEDVHLWPKLLARGPAEIDPLVEVMESRHHGIEETIAEVTGMVEAWRGSADAASAADPAAMVKRMDVLLDEHLSSEEEHVLPLIERYVTAAEWDAMVQGEAADTPQENVPLIFGMMMYEGDPEVIEKALSQMPVEAQPVVREMALEAFATHSQRIHGTPTPRRGRS